MNLTQRPCILIPCIVSCFKSLHAKGFEHYVRPSAYTHCSVVNLLLGLLPECSALLWCLFVGHMPLCTADAFIWLHKTRDWPAKYLRGHRT